LAGGYDREFNLHVTEELHTNLDNSLEETKMKRLVLIISCVLVPASGWGADLSQRLKNQDKRLEGLAEYVSWKQNSIERGYALGLARLRQRAQHRASRIPFTYRFLWTEFPKMHLQKPYPENYFWKSELPFCKDQARLRMAMKNNYFTGTTGSLLLDSDFRSLLEYIVYVDHFQNPTPTPLRNLLYEDAVDLLREVQRFHREAEQLESNKKACLANLEMFEREVREDVLRIKREIETEVKKPRLGVVSAIGYGDTGAFCMIAGVDGLLRSGDTATSSVKINRVDRDEVEFVKNGQTWIQKVGELPNTAWRQ